MSETTQQIGITFSALKALLPRPQLVTGFFKDYLTKFFQEGQVETPELQNLIWGNHERTVILIEPSTRWTPEMASRRPAIIIHGNDAQNMRIGIADRLQGGDNTHSVSYETFWSSSTTLFCIGETGAQAAVLGQQVQRQLTGYEEQIREHLDLHRFRVLTLGAVGELEPNTPRIMYVPLR
jgi:hypothetical protein